MNEINPESLMSHISMVFQDVYLFQDTIRNNIRFGKTDATEEEIIATAKKACCHDFIMRLPQGYDTMVGEGGCTLSGGEKQRISIARAMLKDAQIILLDKTIKGADQIIVLDNGQIKEKGTHETLMQAKGLYAQLWNIQEQISGWKL